MLFPSPKPGARTGSQVGSESGSGLWVVGPGGRAGKEQDRLGNLHLLGILGTAERGDQLVEERRGVERRVEPTQGAGRGGAQRRDIELLDEHGTRGGVVLRGE